MIRENSQCLLKIKEVPKPFRLVFRNIRIEIMSQSPIPGIRCPKCPRRQFSTLVEAVHHVMSERGTSKHVQCCVENCPNKTVRKLRLHIRKIHKDVLDVYLWSCSACQAKFVGRKDLKNHYKKGCPCRSVTSVSLELESKGTKGKYVVVPPTSRLLQVDPPTSRSFRLQTEVVSPKRSESIHLHSSCFA